NKKNGGVDYQEIHDQWHSPEGNADVAVIPFKQGSNEHDFQTLSSEFCATDEAIKEYQIGIGDDLVICGLFTEHTGRHQNVPIVRIGNIAAVPGEPLLDDAGEEYKAYL